MLFCQPNRTFSCSRVLLFPCSPHRTMVKNVVKTRTSKMPMWSPENRSKHHDRGSSRKEKSRRTKHGVVTPKASDEICGQEEPNRMVKPCGHKPLRAGKRTPTSRAFLFPPVSYCNSCCSNCQVQNSLCLLLVGRTRRA